jgi:hypothetical protein
MSVSEKQRDDLTVIKGIGPVREKWLAETLAVSSFGELAALSVDEMEAELKAAGKIASRHEIETWIAQAREIAAANVEARPIEIEKETNSFVENDAVERLKKVDKTTGPVALSTEEAWKPKASFVIEFQTRKGLDQAAEWQTVIQYMESDIEASWTGIKTAELGQWIGEQANIAKLAQSQPADQSLPAQIESIAAFPIDVNAIEVRLIQPPDYSTTIDMATPGRSFLGHVQHEKPVTLEVALEFAERTGGQVLLSVLDYSAKCRLRNLSTRKGPYLLDMEVDPSISEQLSYKTKLSDISLEPGMYELGILISGRRPLNTNYFELPKLNVL